MFSMTSPSASAAAAVIAALSVVCAGVAAPSIKAERRYAHASGHWSDGSIWAGNVAPSEGERIWIQPAADKGNLKISLSQDMPTAFYLIALGPQKGTVLDIDGEGHSFAPTNSLVDTYYSKSIEVAPNWTGNTAAFFACELADAFTEAPFSFSNPLIRICADGDEFAHLEFLRGTVNFYDASGVGNVNRTVSIGGGQNQRGTVTVFSNSTVRTGTLKMFGAAPTNVIRVSACDFTAFGSVWYSDGSAAGSRVHDFVVENGSTLTLKRGLSYFSMENYYPARAKHRPVRTVAVRSGSTIVHDGSAAFLLNSPLTRFEISGGSTFDSSASGKAVNIANGDYSQFCTNCSFVLSGSTFKSSNYSTVFGSPTTPTPLEVLVTNGTFVMSTHMSFLNARCDFSGDGVVRTGGSNLTFGNGSRVEWRCGAIDGGTLYVGGGTAGAPDAGTVFDMTGGRVAANYVQVGNGVAAASATNVLRLAGGEMKCRTLKGSSGTTVLRADGGCIVPAASDATLVSGFDIAETGPRGLAVDTDGIDTAIRQDFADIDGECGLFAKSGPGTLTMQFASYSVATTRVDGGTLAFADAASAAAFSTHLVVDGGGVLSMSGAATALSLAGLSANGGTIILDAGDVVSVSGPVDIPRLRLSFTSTPSPGSTASWLEVDGEMSAATLSQLRRVIVENDIAEGYHAGFSAAYDPGTGKTRVSCEIVVDAEPMGDDDTTVYGGGGWLSHGSWSRGVPTAGLAASFPSSGSVQVPEGAVAAALVLSGGVSLSGGSIEIVGEKGAARIDAAAGSAAAISSGLLFDTDVVVSAKGDSSLSLDGAISGRSLSKEGDGLVRLSASNVFDTSATLCGGTLVAADAGALGTFAPVLKSGTLELDADGMALPAIDVATAAASDAVVVETSRDASLTAFSPACGATIKRGRGRLEIDVSGGGTCRLSPGSVGAATNATGNVANNGAGVYFGNAVFPSDGSAPTSGYGGFTVAEGELLVKGSGGLQTANAGGPVLVGMPLASCAAQPVLTIDGVYFNANDNLPSGTHGAFIGPHEGYDGNATTSATLRVLNGGTFHCNTIRVGYGLRSKGSRVTVAGTNAVFIGGYESRVIEESSAGVAVWRLANSSLLAGYAGVYPVNILGGIDFDASNSTVESNGHAPCGVRLGVHSRGRFFMHDGGVLKVNGFAGGQNQAEDLVFAFDYAEWRGVENGDFTLVRDAANPKIRVEMVGRGLILAPKPLCTFTTQIPFEGSGGLVVTNGGTVAFASGTYGFTGVCDVRDGTVDLSAAGAIGSAAFSGAGTVSGGSLASASINVAFDAESGTFAAPPTFADCTVSGLVKVDLGLDPSYRWPTPLPHDVVVARMSGSTAFSAGRFRSKNAGSDVKGEFSVVDGEVRMAIVPKTRMIVIVR